MSMSEACRDTVGPQTSSPGSVPCVSSPSSMQGHKRPLNSRRISPGHRLRSAASAAQNSSTSRSGKGVLSVSSRRLSESSCNVSGRQPPAACMRRFISSSMPVPANRLMQPAAVTTKPSGTTSGFCRRSSPRRAVDLSARWASAARPASASGMTYGPSSNGTCG